MIAKKLKLDFIDVLIKEIENELGTYQSRKFLNIKGENYFRRFEEKITLKKLKTKFSQLFH